MLTEPVTREIFWQIGATRLFYLAALAALLAFSWGLTRAARFIGRGTRAPLPGGVRRKGWPEALRDAFLHRWAREEALTRLWHALVFYGWWSLVLVTVCVMLAEHLWPGVFQGTGYRLLSLVGDAGGAALLLGACLALTSWTPGGAAGRRVERLCALGALVLICLSGFLLEGLRMALQGDPARAWSPAGWALSLLGRRCVDPRASQAYPGLWWAHACMALLFLAAVPFSRGLRHLLFLVPHRAGQPTSPRVPLPALDRDAAAADPPPVGLRLGIERPEDATARQRLGLLACMDCGRCEAVCPAAVTGQALSPRRFLHAFRACLERAEPRTAGGPVMASLDREALWACRTCLACEEVCPAGIGHVAQIVELRRAEVLHRGRLPDEGAQALWNLARTGDPYGSGPEERAAWQRTHAPPAGRPAGETARVLWPGCFPPGDPVKPRVLDALVSLLTRAGVTFAFPPEACACCGDPARVLGEEDLFLEHAEAQAAWIRRDGVREVLVHCPHCHHALREVVGRFGLDVAVVHTSRLVRDLQRCGRLAPAAGAPALRAVVYHDPCYLGRYHGRYAPPREILRRAVCGGDLVEARDAGPRSFCCGGGGGHFFMDLDREERPASRRLEALIGCGARTVAVSCPFCHAMFDDACRRLPEGARPRVADWLELLRVSLDPPRQAAEGAPSAGPVPGEAGTPGAR